MNLTSKSSKKRLAIKGTFKAKQMLGEPQRLVEVPIVKLATGRH